MAALVWILVETLPEAISYFRRFTKPFLGAVMGPVLSIIFYALGFVRIDFVLAGVLGEAPGYIQGPVRVAGVALMGFIATLVAQKFHDMVPGARADRGAGGGGAP